MTNILRWFKSSYSGSSGGDCLEAAHGWHRSTHSNDSGGQCLEAAQGWHRSTHSNDSGGDCLEASTAHRLVHLRDSKAPDRAMVTVSATAWASFLGGSVIGS